MGYSNRVQARVETHPFARENWETYTPTDTRVGFGVMWSSEISPHFDPFPLHAEYGVVAENDGRGFSLTGAIGVKYGLSPLVPQLNLIETFPLSFYKEDFSSRSRINLGLSWTMLNFHGARVEGGFSFPFPWLNRSPQSFQDGVTAGLVFSLGDVEETRLKPAFVSDTERIPLEKQEFTLIRKSLGLEELDETAPNARIAIFIDEDLWESLGKEGYDTFLKYLASIAEDYRDIEGYDLIFEVQVANWNEALSSTTTDRNLYRVNFVEGVQDKLRTYVDRGNFLGILHFGHVPYIDVRLTEEEYGGPSDYPYNYPDLDISKTDLQMGGLYLPKKEIPTGKPKIPVGRFPSENADGSGAALAIKLMKNAIAYRRGYDKSDKLYIYSADVNRAIVTSDNPSRLRNACDNSAPHAEFISPEEDVLRGAKEDILAALSGSEESQAAHAILLGDHGGGDFYITHDPSNYAALWLDVIVHNFETVSVSDFKAHPVNANFAFFKSCKLAYGGDPEGVLKGMIASGSLVGAAAYVGLSRANTNHTLRWAALMDMELALPPTFNLRAYEAEFFTYRRIVDDSSFAYFGDPFVRYLPKSYKYSRYADALLNEVDLRAVPYVASSSFNGSSFYQRRLMFLADRAIRSGDTMALKSLFPYFVKSYRHPKCNELDEEKWNESDGRCVGAHDFYQTYDLRQMFRRRVLPYLVEHGEMLEDMVGFYLKKNRENKRILAFEMADYYAAKGDYKKAREMLRQIEFEAAGDSAGEWSANKFYYSAAYHALTHLCKLRFEGNGENVEFECGDSDCWDGYMLNRLVEAEVSLRFGDGSHAEDILKEIRENHEEYVRQYPVYYAYIVAAAYMKLESNREACLQNLRHTVKLMRESGERYSSYGMPRDESSVESVIAQIENCQDLAPGQVLDLMFRKLREDDPENHNYAENKDESAKPDKS
jgi:hypothetical protein